MNILDFLKEHACKGLAIPALISAGNFGALLAQSLMDGNIDDIELHQLMQAGSGIQLVILIVVMAVLKLRSSNNEKK